MWAWPPSEWIKSVAPTSSQIEHPATRALREIRVIPAFRLAISRCEKPAHATRGSDLFTQFFCRVQLTQRGFWSAQTIDRLTNCCHRLPKLILTQWNRFASWLNRPSWVSPFQRQCLPGWPPEKVKHWTDDEKCKLSDVKQIWQEPSTESVQFEHGLACARDWKRTWVFSQDTRKVVEKDRKLSGGKV